MAELDQNKVASLHLAQYFVPEAFGYERSAAAASARSVRNVDLLCVEVVDKRIAPTACAVGIVVGRRISDHENRRQIRIDRELLSLARPWSALRVLSLSGPNKHAEHSED